jgi:FKBP-type peptidyl-prolyl cis-trans isomerase 2
VLLVGALLLAACGGDSDDNVQPFAGSPAEPTIGGQPAPPPTPVTNADGTRIAAVGDSVLVHYTGTLDDGSEFDSSVGRDPLSFIVDSGQMIPGFNDAVRGMVLGDKVTVQLDPNEAYGESNPALIGEVALANVPAGTVIGGELFSNDGRSVTVIAIQGATVTLDANHALAGEALTFEIELVEIH